MSKDIFAVKIEGKTRYLRAGRKKLNLPGFGIMSAEEFAKNQQAIELVMENPAFQHVLKEVPEKEYKEVLAAEEKAEADAEELAKAKALEAEKNAYEAAKAVIAAYEAKYSAPAAKKVSPKK
jgi:hypothetical protein